MTPILELKDITKRFGATVTADRLSLTVESGAFFTFLGPSGSGKSTVLRMIAGLEQPDSGQILIDGKDVVGTPPWRRNLGMMFQSYAVFPHMSVAENVAYGLQVRNWPADRVDARVATMLQLIGLEAYADRNATLLSGGEQQRVALARALAPEPRMILLDEPLSALDEKIRRAMQSELKEIHRRTGTTFLYVTHDQEEALTMSDRIAVLNRGECVQCGTPESIHQRPASTFVAQFFRGANVLRAEALDAGAGGIRLRLLGAEMSVLGEGPAPVAMGATLHVSVRAEAIRLGEAARAQPVCAQARLASTVFRGTLRDYMLEFPDGQTATATSTHDLALVPGATVDAGFAPADVTVLED
jgi:ABC-type Fe3+/spermidine/putrescine transport system ATPase subunit